jgi:uncharacterized integral membrane protein
VRYVYILLLVLLVGIVVVFAVQNLHEVSLSFLNTGVTASVALVVGVAYVLGMLTGWTILGLVRRSLIRATESQPKR